MDTYNNLHESLEIYAEWKKANYKRMHTIIFRVYNILEMKMKLINQNV